MKRQWLILTVIMASFVGAIAGIFFSIRYLDQATPSYVSIAQRQALSLVSYPSDSGYSKNPMGIHFGAAAKLVTPAVVHIKTVYGGGKLSLNPLQDYLSPPARSSGSGVIVSDDGYIVTNNHVIEDASRIEVVMSNNQRFYAKLIGSDPSTDLALLKIKARSLPFVRYGDSDKVAPGEWVLAIGNPFDLNSTVTAGIVSAKARNIGILRDRNNLQVESFIQTDAAVNPGNSGGALVNLRGELIGINSAIATSTGNYAGYSFAIPVALVKKIMDDLLEFGQVQRGLLGVQIVDVSAELAESKALDILQGVYIARVNKGSAADESGIADGDVIVAVEGHTVNSVSELQEWIARNRPGEAIEVTYRRNGRNNAVQIVLKNYEGDSQLKKREIQFVIEGAMLEDLTYKEINQLNIDGGVRIAELEAGKWLDAGIRQGFVITQIDKLAVDNVEDLNRILAIKKGGILVEGVYENAEKGLYAVAW